jgi:hypothetical protein
MSTPHVYQRGKPAPWPVRPSHVPPDTRHLWQGIALAWPFWDVRQRQLEDVSGNRLHGVFGTGLLAASDWVVGEHGPGLTFVHGYQFDRVSVADPPSNLLDGTAQLSIEIIFRPTGVTSTIQGLVGKYRAATGARAWRLYMREDEIELQISNDGTAYESQITTAANLVADTLYHVIVTYSAGVFVVWVDGVSKAVDADFATTTIFGGTEELVIAQRTTAGGAPEYVFLGDIYGVRVWTGRALTAADVRQLYAGPWRMYEPDWTLPSRALEHPVAEGVEAGAWYLAGEVDAGVRELVISGLSNGVVYDVQAFTVDTTGNVSAGGDIISGTPAVPVEAARSAIVPIMCGGRPHPLFRRR